MDSCVLFCVIGFMWSFTSVPGSTAVFRRIYLQVLASDHTVAMSL